MGYKNRKIGFNFLFTIILAFSSFLTFQNVSCKNLTETALGHNDICNLNVIPLKYEINLDPIQITKNDKAFVPAWVKINLKIDKNNCTSNHTNNIIKLNTRNCKIDFVNVNVTKVSKGIRQSLNIFNQSFEEKVIDELSPTTTTVYSIQIGDLLFLNDLVELHIPYKLELNRGNIDDIKYEESWQGMYYYDDLVSQNISEYPNFHPMHVQYIFPAFEQFDPWQKPTVKITVARYQLDGFISISNMDVVTTTPVPGSAGWVKDHFRETPPMQLNQVTLLITRGFQNYTNNITNSNDGTPQQKLGNVSVNLWTSQHIHHDYDPKSVVETVNEIWKLLEYFHTQFYGTEHPPKKLDVVVVPWYTGGHRYHANLGVVLAEAHSILLPSSFDDVKGFDTYMRVHEFIRKQIASQWFRGMISSGVQQTKHNYQNGDIWITGDGLSNYVANWALEDNTFPRRLAQMEYRYDFNLGKKLLEMLESAFSRNVLRSAIADFYLPKTAWKGALPKDLYNAIQQAIVLQNATHLLPAEDVTIEEILNTWTTKQYTYPSIVVSEAKTNSPSISLYQTNDDGEDGQTEMWWVPLKILTETGEHLTWLSPNNTSSNKSLIWSDPQQTDPITTTNHKNWLLVNPANKGYYTVEYGVTQIKNIITQLTTNHTVFPSAGRNFLLQNQFNLATYNDWESTRSAFELTTYLGNEMDLNIWNTVIGDMYIYHSKFTERTYSLQKYISMKINNVLEKIGMTPKSGENVANTVLRSKFMEVDGAYEIPLRVSYATKLMAAWMNNTKENPFQQRNISDVQENLYCAAIGSPSEELNQHPAFHFLLELLTNQDPSVNYDDRMCKALTCVKDDSLLASLLNRSRIETGYKFCLEGDNILYALLANRPVLMTQAVYDLWMRDTLAGRSVPASLLRNFWMLLPNAYEPPRFVDGILKFLNEHNDLFTGDLVENVKSFKDAIITKNGSTNYYDEFWRYNGIGNKMNDWFEAHLE